MLQDLKIRIWSTAIAASAGSFEPDALGYGALIALTITALRALGRTIRRSLPASWSERCRTEFSLLRAHFLAERGAHQRSA